FLLVKWAVFSIGCSILALTFVFERRFPREGIRAFAPLWIALVWGVSVHVVGAQAGVVHFAIEAFVAGLLYLVFAASAFATIGDGRRAERVCDAIKLSAAIVSGLGLVQLGGLAEPLFPRVEGFNQPMYGVLGNQGLFGGFVAIGVPLSMHGILSLRRVRPLDVACLALIVPAWVLAGSRSAWLAGTIATVIAMPYAAVNWRRAAALGGFAAAAGFALCIAFPEYTTDRVGKTFTSEDIGGRSRAWYWAAAGRMIGDHWVLGVGPGNYQFASPEYQGDVLQVAGGESYLFSNLQTMNAHSDPIEVFAEYGVVGIACLFWMAWVLVKRCDRPEWGGLCAVAIFAAMYPTFGSPPHVMAGLVLAAALLARPSGVAVQSISSKKDTALDAALLAAATVGATVFVIWALVWPDYLIQQARLENATEQPALESYKRAAEYPWPKPYAREEYGVQLFALQRFNEAFHQFALASYGMDTGDIHQWLGAAYEELGDSETAYMHWKGCVWRWPYNEYAWERLLALSPQKDLPNNRRAAARWFGEAATSGLLGR
ncbi:MAG: O-antigen ligase family protein, partial [Candidatus Hydrogenedentota bacterium]